MCSLPSRSATVRATFKQDDTPRTISKGTMTNGDVTLSAAEAAPGTTITVTVLAENLDLHVADAISVGDKTYDKDHSTGGAIGKITSIERLDAAKTEKLGNGTYARLGNADGCNLLITMECSGSVNEGRYSINRVYELGVNANRNFYTPYAAFTAIVTEIH